MAVTLHNIAGAATPQWYSHATAARGSTIVHVAGQVGTDEQGNLVPGGLAAQAEQAMLNVVAALHAAGAGVGDLVKTTMYVVDWHPSMMPELAQGGEAARRRHPIPDAALTLIGVKSLFTPEMLIEIDAVAVVDA
jgi:enamine deaminase RidA (YjgF/YER057c/UK114 family)